MSNTIRVVAAVLDRQELELIVEDGSTHRLKQGDPRIRPIVAKVTEAIRLNKIPVEIELVAVDNTFTDFEEKTNGAVKLFRVAASKLKKFFGFGSQPVEAPLVDQVIGQIPEVLSAQALSDEDRLAADQKLNSALEEIMEGATPARDNSFLKTDAEANREEETVVVAVVDGKHVVPNADALAAQMRHSVKGDPAGIQNFMRRVGAVASKRSHSMEDLMKFMQRGDLPVTVNGDIVAYKVLRRVGYGQEASYVDCHSRKVKQKIGSRVFMNEKLVDPNRRNECSNGLHVARRQYVRGFSGDVLTIILVRPEDVIAVPNYDANKMRVCGYHIVFELDQRDYRAICGDNPLVTEEGKAALARILAGDNIDVIQTVEITGHLGEGLIITDLVDAPEADEAVKEAQTVEITETTVLAESVDITEPLERKDAPVDVKATAAESVEVKASGTRAEQAKALHSAWVAHGAKLSTPTYANLLDFKKASKTSWAKLGLPSSPNGNVLPSWPTAPKVEPKPLVDPTPRAPELTKVKKLNKRQQKKLAKKTGAPVAPVKPAEPFKAVTAPTLKVEAPKAAVGGPVAQIRALIYQSNGVISVGTAKKILEIKKASKKGWDKLGLSYEEEEDIKALLLK